MRRQVSEFIKSVGFGNLLLVLLLCLTADIWRTQSEILSSIERSSEKPMSTTYVDTAGHQHTVTTPYQETGLAHLHKQHLWDAFQEFEPREKPDWYDPNQRP